MPLQRFLRPLALLAVAATALLPTVSHAAKHSNAQQNLVPPGWPKTIAIPAIGVNAPVEDIALRSKHDLEAPFKWNEAGWYDHGPRPGMAGRAVMFGHLDSTCCPALFWRLNQLKPGDRIQVGYRQRTITFAVMWQHLYANTQLPARWIYTGRSGQRGLVLFTCAGIFHRDGTGYDHKLVIYARMVMPTGRLG